MLMFSDHLSPNAGLTLVVSNYWIGLWTGLKFELNMFVSPDLWPIGRVERSHDLISKYNGLLYIVSCNHHGCRAA